MPALPSRKELESMKRADLQRICKDYGVKANLKSEALIDLLLGTHPAAPHHPPPPQPHPPEPPRRSVSIRQQSIPTAGPSRTTSMIIHDDPEEDEEDRDEPTDQLPIEYREPSPGPPPIPPPRTRKAKELQTRLGVGKPVAAGGSGPRAITRSSGSGSKGKRAKSSKSMKPREAPIQEEPEPTHSPTPDLADNPTIPQDKIEGELPAQSHGEGETATQPGPVLSLQEISMLIARAVQPLRDEIKHLKLELQKVQASESQAQELRKRLVELDDVHKKVRHDLDNVKNIAAGIQTMKDEIQQLRDDVNDQAIFRPSTPKQTGQKTQQSLGFGLPSAFRLGQQLVEVPGGEALIDTTTTTTLGKRSRDATLALQKASEPLRPNAKRPRIDKEDEPSQSDEDNENIDIPMKRSFPAFAVYNGAEESEEPPPPTNHLPDTFAPESAGSSNQGARASSAQGIENQPRSFNFAFQPITSTPNAFPSTFPYPEPPQSPSPAGPGQGFTGHQSGRTDVFKQFGLPSPARPSRLYGPLPVTEDRDKFINPAALSQADPSSRDRPSSGDNGPESSTQRTMYGTELEGDTRFGDFGLEGGVAGGFWPGARF